MTDSQIERVGCRAWGPMVTGFPFAVFLPLMSEALQLVLGVSCLQEFLITPSFLQLWGVGPTGRQPSEEMASFLFLNVRKARLTSTGQRRSGARQKKWEEVAQSWPKLQAVKYQWGRRWKPHQQQPELRRGGLAGAGDPGPEGGPEVAGAASDLPAGGPHTHAGTSVVSPRLFPPFMYDCGSQLAWGRIEEVYLPKVQAGAGASQGQ